MNGPQKVGACVQSYAWWTPNMSRKAVPADEMMTEIAIYAISPCCCHFLPLKLHIVSFNLIVYLKLEQVQGVNKKMDPLPEKSTPF